MKHVIYNLSRQVKGPQENAYTFLNQINNIIKLAITIFVCTL